MLIYIIVNQVFNFMKQTTTSINYISKVNSNSWIYLETIYNYQPNRNDNNFMFFLIENDTEFDQTMIHSKRY